MIKVSTSIKLYMFGKNKAKVNSPYNLFKNIHRFGKKTERLK